MKKRGIVYLILSADHIKSFYQQNRTIWKLFKNLFNKNKNSNKNYHIADISLNLLEHDKNKKGPRFFEFNIKMEWYQP